MSKRYCDIKCDCYNPFNNSNDLPDFSNSTFNSLVILFLFFGGGFSQSSFWGPYRQIYGCSGFNSDWCRNDQFNTFR
ncbi:MAG: hypothetical protein MJ191_03765 [Clostridium sp.]|nr:hypothetical protein [Clostridium sp.]